MKEYLVNVDDYLVTLECIDTNKRLMIILSKGNDVSVSSICYMDTDKNFKDIDFTTEQHELVDKFFRDE